MLRCEKTRGEAADSANFLDVREIRAVALSR
jgi:hypothetical protein